MQRAVNNMSSLKLVAKLEEEKLTMKEEEEKLTTKESRKIQACYSLAAASLSMEYDRTQQSTKNTDSGWWYDLLTILFVETNDCDFNKKTTIRIV